MMKEKQILIATTEEGEEETVFIENIFEKNNNSTKGTNLSYRIIKERVSSKSLLVKVGCQCKFDKRHT